MDSHTRYRYTRLHKLSKGGLTWLVNFEHGKQEKIPENFRPPFLKYTFKVAIYSIWKSNFIMTIMAFKQIGGH